MAKAKTKAGAEKAPKRQTGLRLSEDTLTTLSSVAAYNNESLSDIAERALSGYLAQAIDDMPPADQAAVKGFAAARKRRGAQRV